MGSNASMGLRPMWTKEAATALFVGVFIVKQQKSSNHLHHNHQRFLYALYMYELTKARTRRHFALARSNFNLT